MARETRIGIALMVLLVGVFGAIVYKKWNGRQPTVLAAASEESLGEPSKIPDASPKAVLNTSEQDATPAEDENPFTTADTNGFDPFGEASPSPMAQAEPMPVQPSAPVQEDPFSFDEVAESNTTPPDREPNRVVEPAPESIFADAANSELPSDSPFESEMSPAASSPATVASTTPAPTQPATLDDDPFADPIENAADSTDTDAKVAVTTVEDDDPFSAPVTTNATPVETASNGETGSDSFVSETQIPSPEIADAALSPSINEGAINESDVVSDSDVTSDPFSDAPSQTMEATASETVANGQESFVSDDSSSSVPDDELFSDSAAPAEFVPESSAASVAGFDGGFDEDFKPASEAELTSQSVTAPSAEEPITPTSSRPRSDYHIVADNESYWTISNKIYGTSAFYHALAQYNIDRIKDPNRLKAGWKILTPPADELRSKFPQLVASVPQAESSTASRGDRPGFLLDAQGRPCYRVGDLDTLGGIAQVHLGRASRWVQIYELNRTAITNPKSLKPGTVLRLPPDASRVRLVPEG